MLDRFQKFLQSGENSRLRRHRGDLLRRGLLRALTDLVADPTLQEGSHDHTVDEEH